MLTPSSVFDALAVVPRGRLVRPDSRSRPNGSPREIVLTVPLSAAILRTVVMFGMVAALGCSNGEKDTNTPCAYGQVGFGGPARNCPEAVEWTIELDGETHREVCTVETAVEGKPSLNEDLLVCQDNCTLWVNAYPEHVSVRAEDPSGTWRTARAAERDVPPPCSDCSCAIWEMYIDRDGTISYQSP